MAQHDTQAFRKEHTPDAPDGSRRILQTDNLPASTVEGSAGRSGNCQLISGIRPDIQRMVQTTGLLRVPTPLTDTSTTSPDSSGPTPDGVPVMITSPASRVMTWLI